MLLCAPAMISAQLTHGKKAGAAGAICHEIIGKLAQQSESARGIPSHVPAGI